MVCVYARSCVCVHVCVGCHSTYSSRERTAAPDVAQVETREQLLSKRPSESANRPSHSLSVTDRLRLSSSHCIPDSVSFPHSLCFCPFGLSIISVTTDFVLLHLVLSSDPPLPQLFFHLCWGHKDINLSNDIQMLLFFKSFAVLLLPCRLSNLVHHSQKFPFISFIISLSFLLFHCFSSFSLSLSTVCLSQNLNSCSLSSLPCSILFSPYSPSPFSFSFCLSCLSVSRSWWNHPQCVSSVKLKEKIADCLNEPFFMFVRIFAWTGDRRRWCGHKKKP